MLHDCEGSDECAADAGGLKVSRASLTRIAHDNCGTMDTLKMQHFDELPKKSENFTGQSYCTWLISDLGSQI